MARYHVPSRARASSIDIRRAACFNSGVTQRAKGVVLFLCAPDGVCSWTIAVSRSCPISSASRTSAGHNRRCTKVSLPSTRGKQRTSGESAIVSSAAKISRPRACPHQLPRMGPPVIASARLGTGPRADASTTPCFSTNATGLKRT